MNFDLNNFHFDAEQLPVIEKRLEDDGYVRIQFSPEDFPSTGDLIANLERFFIEIIEKLGGQCLAHNEDKHSFVWHVRPMEINGKENFARSQTDAEFFFHTDCSYELNPPEYMALVVLEPDQNGGGELEIIQLADILQSLSETSKTKLRTTQYRIDIPVEFRKSSKIDHINAPILCDDKRIRYRSDILSEDEEDHQELNELNFLINQVKKYRPKLDRYTMIILNNQKYLHGRTKILDYHRHLLRIRFNRPLKFDVFSIYDQEKLSKEYLIFNNHFYDYLDNQQKIFYQTFELILKEYNQPTSLGEMIRENFQFNEKIHWILMELNRHRPNFSLGSYRPDILFQHGNSFQINGKLSFQPKFCEINARFPLNGYFLSAALCSTDHQNRYSTTFSHLIETILQSSKFDFTKRMFILKGKENGYDIHLFQQYWKTKYSCECLFIHPKQLTIVNNQLIDRKTNYFIEQFLLELHQEEILQLSDEILRELIQNQQLKYFNDFRTIFILHDKRLFALLSNEQFLYALMNNHQQQQNIRELIPITYVIHTIPTYLKESMIKNKEHWIIKPNSAGKGENILIGSDVTTEEWSKQFSHQEWIVQEYIQSIQYQSMNLSGMLFCFNDQCFNMGMIRISLEKIVNISHGGSYIRPYIHQEYLHSTTDQTILTKEKLHQQLIQFQSWDNQWNQSVYFSSSGGSGGKRLFFATDIKQNQFQRQILVKLMIEQEIISAKDICLNLFQSNNIYRSSEIFNDFCTIANCTSLPMNADARDEDILEIIKYFRPNILMGSPYRLMQLAFCLEQHGDKEIRFEKIYFACESLDGKKQKYFQDIFHCSIFLGFYGSAETGVFACQSPEYSSTKIYLYPKDLVHIEIINSKIIVTNLIRKRNQLIRFDTGDLGRLIPHEKYGLIEVFHSQRLIMIGNDTLSKSEIEETMKQFDFIEWQLMIDYVPKTKTKQIQLLFRYVQSEMISNKILEENIRNYLQNFFDKSLTKISEKLILRFQSIQYDQLIRNKTSNKLLKIIDQR